MKLIVFGGEGGLEYLKDRLGFYIRFPLECVGGDSLLLCAAVYGTAVIFDFILSGLGVCIACVLLGVVNLFWLVFSFKCKELYLLSDKFAEIWFSSWNILFSPSLVIESFTGFGSLDWHR